MRTDRSATYSSGISTGMPRLICGDQSALRRLLRPAARRRDRLLEQLLVELDADLADVARLLLAQQIAGAADVEVVAGELEAGAQRVERLHDLEPLGRRLVQRLARRHGEIGIGAGLAAADAAAQLVELGQAEHVGAMDDHRVGVADVEAAFDDVGRQQQVELAVDEVLHGVLDLGRRQRPCAMAMRISGTSSRSSLGDRGEILDARADIEALAAAILLAQQRLADGHAVERHHEGAHRQAIDRRRGDQAHVAHAGQRELQGARDRRRGQRQHMDVGAQLLQPLLVRDAEMLLLVDDQQAEILELDALGQQRVRADDDVDRAVLERRPWSPWPPWPAPGATAGRSAPASPGSARRRSRWCWRASRVVGPITATCLPDMAATKAARRATSVLPKPTSPQISRSIGLPDDRSSSTSAMACSWSSVSA